MDCDVWNFALNYTTTCTDLTNFATMQIEIIIGVIGAIIITGAFVKRESNRKKLRGKILTKTIVNPIISLRYHVRAFIKLLINETQTGRPTKPENLVDSWNTLQLWRPKIAPLFAISGEVISAEQQIVLTKILEDLDKKFDFTHIEMDQSELHGLDAHLTEYLRMNKEVVREENNEMNSTIQERIDKTKNAGKTAGGESMIKRWQAIIDENEEMLKDILND